MKTPHREWAIEKVRTCSPRSKEKSTLLAIAKYADPDGTNSYCKIETIADYSGHDERTVKRHIKSLSSRCTWPRVIKDPNYITSEDDFQAEAELRVIYQGKKPERTNLYAIHVCTLTEAEREEITGISRRQLKLAIPRKQELSKTTIENTVKNLLPHPPIENYERSPESEKEWQEAMTRLELSMQMDSIEASKDKTRKDLMIPPLTEAVFQDLPEEKVS